LIWVIKNHREHDMNNTISAYILAGGKSTRFKGDKTLYSFNGKPLIEHVYEKIRPLFDETGIISNDTEKFNYLGIPVYPDIIEGKGPIGGIYTALNVSKAHRVFIFATDMPYLSGEFISYMAQLPDFYDVTVPHLYGNYEPLHAIYSKNCIPPIKDIVDADERKIIKFFQKVALREVIEDEIFFYAEDPSSIFANINYQDDITPLH